MRPMEIFQRNLQMPAATFFENLIEQKDTKANKISFWTTRVLNFFKLTIKMSSYLVSGNIEQALRDLLRNPATS